MSRRRVVHIVRPEDRRYILFWIGAFGLLSLGSWFLWPSLVWWNLLIGIEMASVLLMAVDKISAMWGKVRVPERTLFLVAFLGGSPAVLLSMLLFRHKVSKVSFQFWFAMICVFQVGLCAYILWYTQHPSV